jgi:hypothetical protein
MSRSIMFVVIIIVVSAFGVQSGVQQPIFRNNAPRQPNNPGPMRGDRRPSVQQLSGNLVREAEFLSKTSFDHFKGWNGEISNKEQAVLFKTEEFAAACRLFNRLTQDQTNYFRRDSLQTNLHNASRYVEIAFRQLEDQIRQSGMQREFDRTRRDIRPGQQQSGATAPLGLPECRRILDRIEDEFTNWR